MVAEAGEFMELVKKIKFQGKPWNDDVKDHLVTELGDVCGMLHKQQWHWMNVFQK